MEQRTFKIVVESDKTVFESKVSEAMGQGFELVGGTSYSNSVFVQSLIKEEKIGKDMGSKGTVPGPVKS